MLKKCMTFKPYIIIYTQKGEIEIRIDFQLIRISVEWELKDFFFFSLASYE